MDVAGIVNPIAMIISVPDGLALLHKQSHVKRENVIFLRLKPPVMSLITQFHVPAMLKKQ